MAGVERGRGSCCSASARAKGGDGEAVEIRSLLVLSVALAAVLMTAALLSRLTTSRSPMFTGSPPLTGTCQPGGIAPGPRRALVHRGERQQDRPDHHRVARSRSSTPDCRRAPIRSRSLQALTGSMWFTQSGRNRIGAITMGGTITELSGSLNSPADGIVLGPDGDVCSPNPPATGSGR